jgi:hypothetical protein
MTRKQFRKWKQQNKLNKQMEAEIANERPEWADDEKQVVAFETWRTNFLAEVHEAIKDRLLKGPEFNY